MAQLQHLAVNVRAYNWSRVQRRDKRIYSLFNTTISQQGVSMDVIKYCCLALGLFSIPGLAICAATGTFLYNPFGGNSSASGVFFFFFVLTPIVIGVSLNTYKVQNYRLVDFIKLYLQPKTPVDIHGRRVKFTGFKITGFVERL